MTSRRAGRVAAVLVALAAFGSAAYTGLTESMPEFRIYDGLWMLLGVVVGLALVGPLIWNWPRPRALAAVVLTSIAASWLPLVISALRHRLPVLVRLKGAWVLAGGDVVGVSLPVGAVFLWLALRDYRPTVRPSSPDT